MARFSFSSLRVRLLLLVFLAILPSLGFILHSTWEQRRQRAADMENDALQVAEIASADHERLIEGAHQLLAALARLPAVRQHDAPACSALFASLLKQFEIYANLGAVKSNGELFCGALPFRGPINLSDRIYFRRALETRAFAVGEYQVGRVTGKATLNFGYPVLGDSDQVQAVVFAALDLAWLNELAAKARLSEGSTLTLIDRAGVIIARHPDPVKWVGKSAPDARIVKIVLAQGQGVAEAPDVDGTLSVFGFTPLHGAPAAGSVYVAVGIPTATAYADANRVLIRSLMGLGLAVALAFVATWVGGDLFILRRARALVRATKRLAAGDLRARAGLSYGKGELSQLSHAFDEMAESLERSASQHRRVEEELRKVNRALRVLSACNLGVVRAAEESELLQVVCQSIVDVGGYRFAWIGFAVEDDAKTVRPAAQAGYEEGYLESVRITWADTERGRGPVGTAIQSGKPCIIKDILTDDAFAPWRAEAIRRGYASVIALPLLSDGRRLGALAIYAATPDAFDTEEVTLLVELANDLAYGIVALRTRTERERAEAELRRQRETLHQSEKLAAMGQLLAGVAHELNNPLSVIAGQTTLLRQTVEGGPLAARAEKIGRAAERCARIVKNFLALARQRLPERQKVPLNQVVEEAVELLAYQLRVDDVEVTLDLAKGLPLLWADPHQLQQVVVNLVSNAQQAMHETPPPRRLTLSTRYEPARGSVSLEVADAGPGIPPEIQHRIFEPFFTTKPPGQGTGLGLSLCHSIIEAHGGSIRVESEPGQGAVFRIELPVKPLPEDLPETRPAEAAPAITGKTILVVDDEPEIGAMLAEMLSLDGYQVETAANGALALDKLRERTYDVVLSDVKMPELDGPGLYREVERRYPGLRRRFIFFTGDTLSAETREFLEKTGAPNLSKPFVLDEIRLAVRRALGVAVG